MSVVRALSNFDMYLWPRRL